MPIKHLCDLLQNKSNIKAHSHQFQDDCNGDTSGYFHAHYGLNLEQIVKMSYYFYSIAATELVLLGSIL